jgi:L-galactono-1,4-lactone dehydrogenase
MFRFSRSSFHLHLIGSFSLFSLSSFSSSVPVSLPVSYCDFDESCHVHYDSSQILSNWSSTHSIQIKRLYEPKTERELERLLRHHQYHKIKIRPIGTGLSPNGLSFPSKINEDVISVHNFNQIQVDPVNKIVTVGAGATVANILKELSKYGLTLENFSSIQEQQIAGWTQVAAHGTGCLLPTVEEQIISMKVVTPNEGVLSLSDKNLSPIFKFAKVGLGSVGVVTELKLKCIPRHFLKEETKNYDRNTIRSLHYSRLRNYRHVRYMWIPYTPMVVSVISNPLHSPSTSSSTQTTTSKATQEFINLIKANQPSGSPLTDEYLRNQGFGSLRDLALGIDPLNLQVVIPYVTSVIFLFFTCSTSRE